MVSKELKKLSRRELVDIIYQMKKNEQQLQEEVAALKEELQDKRIRIEETGSVAAAALSITDVLGAAQRTADLYLHEITCMKEDAEKECALITLKEIETYYGIATEDGYKSELLGIKFVVQILRALTGANFSPPKPQKIS